MKKLLFLAGMLAATVSSRAQFFQWVYGDNTSTSGFEELYNGVRMTTTDKGSIMAGFSRSTSGLNLYVAKCDLNGKTLSSPYFNNIYPLYDIFGNSFTVIQSKILEFQDGSGYAAAGWFQNNATGQPGIYYLRLDVSGNPVAGRYYQLASATSSGFRMGSLREDLSGKYVYITGSVHNPSTGNYDVFVQKVDQNGTLGTTGTWSVTYNLVHPTYSKTDDMGWDVMESMYASEVLIAGSVKDIFGKPADAFVMRLKSTTGSFGSVCFYGDPNTEDEFRSINHSFAPIGGTKGYIVGGSTPANSVSGDNNFWTVRIDPNLNVQWATIHDYNGVGFNPNNYCNMVIERLNTFSKYEFYAVGHTDDGVFGGQDVEVVKMDATGFGVGNGQFTYGGSGSDRGAAVDQDNSGVSDGLYVYGTTDNSFGAIGSRDFYNIKAYFNGPSGCNDKMMDPVSDNGPGLITKGQVNTPDKMPDDDIKWDPPIQYGEKTLCYNTSLPSGNNSLAAKVTNDLSIKEISAGTAVVISPNPVEQGATDLQLKVTAPAGTLEVIVADYMGRQYINQRFDMRNGGEQTLMVELGKANLAPGLYLLKVNGLNKPSSQVLIVK